MHNSKFIWDDARQCRIPVANAQEPKLTLVEKSTTASVDYYDNPAISQSMLKEFKKSPRHYYVKYVQKFAGKPETTAQKIGTLIHVAIYEPAKLHDKYYVLPEIDRRTKEGKAEYNQIVEANSGKSIITQDELDMAIQIRQSVINKKTSRIVLDGGKSEVELYWVDKATGANCKAKVDYLIEPCDKFPNGLIIDTKSTTDATQDTFAKDVYKYGYYLQAAWYREAIKSCYGTAEYPDFIFNVVEKTLPYETAYYCLDNETLNIGHEETTRLLSQLVECKNKNIWKGYTDKIETISLPSWVMNRVNNNL